MAYVHHNLPLCILTLGDGHFCHMKLGVWIFGGKYLWLLVSNLHFFFSLSSFVSYALKPPLTLFMLTHRLQRLENSHHA